MTGSTQVICDQPTKCETAPRDAIRRKHHRFILGLAIFAVVMSFVLEVVPEGRVAVHGFEQWPLPHSCYARMLFDRGCPGCGLTRGFIHLAHGRLSESLAVNRVGWTIALATLLQIPYRIIALRSETGTPLGTLWPRAIGWTILVLLFSNWCYELLSTV